MNYEFSLTKSSLVSITLGSFVIGVLLFAAGLIVGSQWLTSSAAAADTTAKNEESDLPTEPVLNDEKAALSKSAPAKTAAPASPQQPAAATAPKETAQATAADTKLTADEVRIISEATDPASEETAASEPEYVTVQVGVFLDEKEANRLLKDIERKGYAPSFFSGRDAEARQWYAVRIGAYSDKQQASNAAANFTKQEKIKAVVRPLGSL